MATTKKGKEGQQYRLGVVVPFIKAALGASLSIRHVQ